MRLDRQALEIDAPTAECGHCGFTSRLSGTWSVEGGRLVFRAMLAPLARRGPDFGSCCESDPVAMFTRITVDGEPLTDSQVAELQAAEQSPGAWDEERRG